MTDRFLMEFKAAYQGKRIGVSVRSGVTWIGTLNRADESGLWLVDDEDVSYLAWVAIEAVTRPPDEDEA